MVDLAGEVKLTRYADADFAGGRPSYKSTSGMTIFIEGADTLFPIAAKVIKQICRSHSTPEADIVSMNTAIRTVGLRMHDLWEPIVGNKMAIDFTEYDDSRRSDWESSEDEAPITHARGSSEMASRSFQWASCYSVLHRFQITAS